MTDRTKPLPRTQRRLEGRELNRGLQKGRGSETNQRKDNVKNVSIGLMDVDAAIMYYFYEVIKPIPTIAVETSASNIDKPKIFFTFFFIQIIEESSRFFLHSIFP